jgi:hypothetical protein
MPPILIIREPLSREALKAYLLGESGLVKAVVDCEKGVMAVGGALHADGEHVLLQDGSKQEHLWGINLYPDHAPESFLEFDSMINIRPRQGNRSRSVDDPVVQERIRAVVRTLIA